MKILTAFLCIVPFAFIQATSEPVTPQQLIANALGKCIQEKKSDVNKIKEIFKNDILPEDNPEFTDFFTCYWKAALVILDDGTFDNLHIRMIYPFLIRDRYPNISEDDSRKLSDAAVDNCKDISKGDSIGLRGIQYRNCLTKDVISRQT